MKRQIKEYPIPMVLKDILSGNLSGELIITGPKFQKTLFFMDGALVSAQSNQMDERIGVILYLIGKISQEVFDNMSGLVHSVNQELGEILVQNGFISKHDLYSARRYLVRRIVFSTFLLEQGEWEFKKGVPNIPESEKFFIQLPGIIIEGTRKLKNLSYFKNSIYFKSPITTGIPGDISPLLAAQEKEFYGQLENCQNQTNREIISQLNMVPDTYWQFIALFIMLDLVDFKDLPQKTDITSDIQALLKLNNLIQEKDPGLLALLGLDDNASIQDIEDAYHNHINRFNPARFGSGSAPEIKRIAASVMENLDKAYHKSIQSYDEISASPLDLLGNSQAKPRDKSNLLFQRALTLKEQKKFEESIRLLKEAIKLQPKQANYYCLLGECQSEIDYFHGDAERNLKKAIELDPNNPDPVYALGLLFRNQNKMKLSEKCFQHVLEIDNTHYQAGKAIATLSNPNQDRGSSLFSIWQTKK